MPTLKHGIEQISFDCVILCTSIVLARLPNMPSFYTLLSITPITYSRQNF